MTTLVHVTTTDISLALLLGPQLRAFADAGYEVIGVSAAGTWTARLDALGVAHEPLRHATRSWAPVEDVRALVELWRLFRRLRPDIVHTHNPKPGIYGRLAARLAGVPVVVNTVHGLYAVPGDRLVKRAPVYALERLAAACSDAELVQGPEDLETLASIGVSRRKLALLGNGVDLRRFDPASVSPAERAAVRSQMGAGTGDVVCGFVGRLVREKGLDDLFAAARLLGGVAPSVRVVVIGLTDPGKVDGYTAADLAVVERDTGVRFLGVRDDMPACYAAMDLLVFPSHREGFPRAPMEAAAMARPVIASDVRGCREVVEHDVTGLLVPERDPTALVAAIAALAADPDRRHRQGAAGRDKAGRDFDDRRVIARTLDTYRRALARRGRVAPNRDLGTAGDVRLRLATIDDARAAAALHHGQLADGFLATLGLPFLRRLYRRIIRWPGSFVVVAEIEGRVVGMSAATVSVGGLYRAFAVRDGVAAAAAAAPTVARSWRRVLETARYGVAQHGSLPAAELLSLAVDPVARRAGVGRALAAAVVAELRSRGVEGARVVVAAENGAARRAYATAGFRPATTVAVHEGVHQQVLVWP